MAGLGPRYIKRAITFNATRKGLLGGSRPWLVVFGLIRLARWSGKVTKRGEAPITFSEKLKVGESYEIVHMSAKQGRKIDSKA